LRCGDSAKQIKKAAPPQGPLSECHLRIHTIYGQLTCKGCFSSGSAKACRCRGDGLQPAPLDER
jgi:hypothetical protein